MTTREKKILPRPESTYRLLLDAAGAWPDGIATQWIPDPADYTRRLDWTYTQLAAMLRDRHAPGHTWQTQAAQKATNGITTQARDTPSPGITRISL